MGLKEDLIRAKQIAWKTTERPSGLVKEAELTRDAIIKFLTSEDLYWTINKLKASVELETLEIEDISADVAPKTLLGPYAPVVDALKSLGIDIEAPIKKAISLVSKGGASANIDSRKDGGQNGNLKLGTGHAYIGDGDVVQDSDTTESDNDFTKVRLNINNIPKDLL
tara:strand:- start:37 stop:537 length:501 start_codon:yes stop_codon:yes gene_type:complete